MRELRHTKDLVGKPVEVRVLFRALLFGNEQLRELKKLLFLCPETDLRPFFGHLFRVAPTGGWSGINKSCDSFMSISPFRLLLQEMALSGHTFSPKSHHHAC
jgi:hypothetical protein